MKTLKEVVDLVGMTRRMIQEYEKAGLTKTPTTTDKYGHLLYDEATIERLWQIRFYRELEYDKEQIRKAFTDPNYNKHDAIADQIIKLEEKKKKLESMIKVARAYNEMDVLPSNDWVAQNGLLESISFNTWMAFTAKLVASMNDFLERIDWEKEMPEEFWKELLVDWPTEKIGNQWVAAVQEIGTYYAKGLSYKSAEVQEQVSIMQRMDAEAVSTRGFKCWLRTYVMVSEIYDDDIKEAFEEDGCQYIIDAVDFYGKDQWVKYFGNAKEFAKTPVGNVLENIQNYGVEHFTAGSNEVQNEVKNLHKIISDAAIVSKSTEIELLELFSNLMGSQETTDSFDSNREKNICWFISRAVQIYCDRQREMTEKEENNE